MKETLIFFFSNATFYNAGNSRNAVVPLYSPTPRVSSEHPTSGALPVMNERNTSLPPSLPPSLKSVSSERLSIVIYTLINNNP